MNRLFLVAGTAVFCLTLFVSAQGGDKVGEKKPEGDPLANPYYPLKVGTTWEYRSGGKKVVLKVAAHEKVEDMTCARLETEVGGGKMTEHIAVKADGIYRVRANNQDIKPPLLLLRLPLEAGKSWNVNSMVQNFAFKGAMTADEEMLKVGKDELATIRVKSSDFTMAGQNVEMETWYAKDKGMVKQRFKLPSAELEVVLELESFTPGQ